LQFLNKCGKCDFDIYIILSFHSDIELLNNYNYKNPNIICLEDHFNKDYIQNVIDKNVIVTFKKFFGLRCLTNKQYEYCATVDSEIEFINTLNTYDKFKNFCNNKRVVGSDISNSPHNELLTNINVKSAALFLNNESHYNQLKTFTKNFSLYFWFSDIPIYDMSVVPDFLNYIRFDYNFIDGIDWHCFDYVPYIYYVCLFKNYTIVNCMDFEIQRCWSLESMPINTYLDVVEKINYKPLWVIANTYLENKELLNDEIIMIYHINDGRYH
jgi:hypothetical protein